MACVSFAREKGDIGANIFKSRAPPFAPLRMACLLVAGIKVETIVDDNEGLVSFHVAWQDAGGYFLVARERGETQIYCELNDQANGFYSKTLKYSIDDRKIKFVISNDEYFDAINGINEIEVVIPEGLDMGEISACLEFIFAWKSWI
jgi:hypothetical protein